MRWEMNWSIWVVSELAEFHSATDAVSRFGGDRVFDHDQSIIESIKDVRQNCW